MSTSNPVRLTARLLAFACLALFTAHCLLLTVRAQSATATLSGTVEDEKGAVVPGAAVTLTNSATGLRRETTTNDQGSFVVPLLPPSTYKVRVERTGFALVEIPSVELNVGDEKALQVQLRAGGVSETVLVEDSSTIKTDGAVGTVVDRQFVENLPLNGRSFQALITLSPGIVLTKATGDSPGQFSANGQRANSNYFTVDGVSANIGVSPGQTAGQSTGGTVPGFATTGGTNNLVSVDALQEFKILTSSFAPEFGRTPGAQISIVTRGGTNEYHGTVFEYFRNDALDANDWFNNANRLPKPPLRQNDFGGVISGPLYLPRFGEGGPSFYDGKNRTFFFFSYEGLRLRLPQTGITTVPSLAARMTAPVQIQPFLNAFPIPNGRNLLNNFAEFNASYSDPSSLDATSIRVDHALRNRLTLFGRYNYSPSETTQRGGANSLNTLSLTSIKTHTLTGGAGLVITPAITNDFRANYSRNGGSLVSLLDTFGGAVPLPDSLLFPPSASSQNGFFGLNISGGSSSNLAQGAFQNDLQRQINVVNTLSIVAGSHQLKFGGDYRRLFPIFDRSQYSQQALFNGVNQALTGRAGLALIAAFDGPLFPRFTNLSFFGQDTWKVNARLTLTYGLRWEINPPPSEANGNDPFVVMGLDNAATVAFAPPGTPLYETTYDNVAPRFGVAFQLSQKQGRETVLRGGFGVFYDLGTGAAASAFGVSFPYFRQNPVSIPGGVAFPLDPTLAAPPPLSLTPPFRTIRGVLEPDFELPYTHQWNIAIEQSLGTNQTVSASYVAAVGRRLTRQENLSAPNPNFQSLLVTRNSATSDYHAMQLQFQRRLSRGFQALASYTWSHSLDDVSSDSSIEPSLIRIDPKQERGSSNFDVRHTFNAAVTYNLPTPASGTFGKAVLGNWSVDTIVTARSATPVNVISGAGLFGVFSVARPDVLQGVPLYIDDPAVAGGRRINRAAFTVPPAGRQGTLGRNALRGFPLWQLDLALRRQFNLTERVNLQLRGEFFNLFNHPNFADPVNSLSNVAFFGQSTLMLGRSLGSGGSGGGFNPLYQVGGPRSVQLALKLGF